RNGPCKIHRINFSKGKVYQIDMTSTDFDAYLRIEDAAGRHLAADDDSGGQLNARIIFKAPEDGTYRIIATAFIINGAGNYRLTVVERSAPKPAIIRELKIGNDGVRDKLEAADAVTDRLPAK